MSATKCYLNALGILCAAGDSAETVNASLLSKKSSLAPSDAYSAGRPLPLGLYTGELPENPLTDKKWQSRNNQFALAVLSQMETEVSAAIAKYGASRVGVVIGTSTSGIAEGEPAVKQWAQTGEVPPGYDYGLQEMGATAQFVATILSVKGPTYGISTACSSGAKALASAKRLIQAGICDVVIAGGVDTLCHLTVQGFSSIEAVSDQQCNPFSANRNGINIGEGAALFLVSSEPVGVELAGVGESSDAHHISAPDPTGAGAVRCMSAALKDASVEPEQVDYVNLHGTATGLNDQMEALAMNEVFGTETLCSSTKPFIGHTLGAAGAVEAGICWLMLNSNTAENSESLLPVHLWDGAPDPELPEINLITAESKFKKPLQYVLSNSYAFGGNNISLLLERLQ
ncbi:MAG: beta-ketoacyl-[acyl-carrier-protein] synthase family protein [Proteobacteria bacterium]|nr:beta-ketoacyl-[acyl-carrier-protein] synthase family protein [Pseudomonadota bacterium]